MKFCGKFYTPCKSCESRCLCGASSAKTALNMFYSASLEVIGVKVPHRLTDSLTPYTWVCRFFLSVKFATSSLACSLVGDKQLILKNLAFIKIVNFIRISALLSTIIIYNSKQSDDIR